MKEIIVGANEQDKRLDGFLKSYLKEASTGFIYKMLRKKNITLNNKKAEGTEKLVQGDVIKIFFADETLSKFRGEDNKENTEAYGKANASFGKFPVIYEDDNIVLVNKPAGILSQKASASDISLNEWLIDYLLETRAVTEDSLETYRPSICNRLDRNTSGLVICAKNLSGARVMNSIIKDRRVDKYYRTIVTGRLSEEIALKGFLMKDEKKNKVLIKKEDPGDPSFSYIETEYRPLSYDDKKDMTSLEVRLITGKPHQIRAHLSSIGHPIIGDVKYGGPVLKGLKYQLLHSYRVEFPSDMEEPFSYLDGKEFIAPLPEIFNRFL